MKKTLGTLRLSAIVCCLAVMVACSNDDTPVGPEPEKQHTEAVNELIRLLDGNPEVKALLEKSITKEVGGQAVLGRQSPRATPWPTERHGYDPTCGL